MKIISAIVLSFMVFTSVVNAQNSKVTTAANARYAGEYDKAKQAIDEAILNEKTSVQAKTWVIRGDIHNDIAKDTTGKYSNIANPLEAAFESFKTALTMEDSKNYKVKVAEGLFTTYNLYFIKGLDAYNAGNIEDAYKNFYMANQANMIQMDANPLAILDTGVFYNMGLMAERLGKNAEAIAVYQKLLDINYKDRDLYIKLSKLYTDAGSNELAVKILDSGRLAMPNDKEIMNAELNYYIAVGKLDILVSKLESAIISDPKNADLYFLLGTTHGELISADSSNRKKHFDAAINAYDKALAIDPNRFDINLNAGALFYNTAIEMNKVMNSLPLEKEKEYESLKIDRNKLYRLALPYFENAYRIDPTNTDCLLALKEIYVRLDMKDKTEEIKQKLSGNFSTPTSNEVSKSESNSSNNSSNNKGNRIIMVKEGGVYTVPCVVNGLNLKFVFDTGASNVSISLTEALFMLKNGYLSYDDIIGEEKFSDAKGEISTGMIINIREISFGGQTLKNVEATVVDSMTAPLLLGQSALNKLGKVTIDYNENVLIFE